MRLTMIWILAYLGKGKLIFFIGRNKANGVHAIEWPIDRVFISRISGYCVRY
jgi:hypothetical protein